MSGASALPYHAAVVGVGQGDQARRAVYRYGAVLLTLAAAFTFAMIAPSGNWARLVFAILEGIAVLAVLLRAGVGRRLFGVAMVVIAVAFLSGVVATFAGGHSSGVAELAAAALLVLVPISIAIEFRRGVTVTVQSVMAAVCVYIVFGIFFAELAAAVSDLSGLAYFAGERSADSSDYVYFSFITLTTVGYGDFAPALRIGRALAVLEGLTGQLYLVTVVAVVVSNLAPRRPAGAPGQHG